MEAGRAKQYSSLSEEFAAEKARLIEGCDFCGDCLEVCPVFPMRSSPQEGPVEVQEKLIQFLKGGGPQEAAGEHAFSCAGCALCVNSCPQGLNPLRLREVLKAELVGCGYHPPSVAQAQIGDRAYDLNQVIGSLQIKPSQVRWLTQVPPDPQPKELVVFLGCNVFLMPDKVLALMDLLEMTGLDFVALAGGDLCCGSKHLLKGELEKTERATGDYLRALSAFRPRRVALWCGTCYSLTRNEFPKYADIPFEPIHVSQLLVEQLPKLKLTRPVEATVTLHDSCNLGRKGRDFESVRTLLRAIPGLTLVEMARNREDAPCCGGGAQRHYPRIAEAMRRQALDEVRKTGAQIMTTVCQGCHRYFNPAGWEYPFQIKNYVTLLAEAAGYSYEDKLQRYLRLGSLEGILEEAREYVEAGPYTVEELRQLLPLYFGPSFSRSAAQA
ncbi:MAG: (Fe-S)-binding protein [Dehalococcoidia bacterium]